MGLTHVVPAEQDFLGEAEGAALGGHGREAKATAGLCRKAPALVAGAGEDNCSATMEGRQEQGCHGNCGYPCLSPVLISQMRECLSGASEEEVVTH